MDYSELKEKTLEWIKNHVEFKERAIQELMRAKIAFDNGIDLINELNSLKQEGKLADGYILPVILGLAELKEIVPIEDELFSIKFFFKS